MGQTVTAADLCGFDVIEEQWTDYELEDGTLVRMRPVLVYLLPSTGDGPNFRITNQIQTWSPPNLRDADGPSPPANRAELDEAAEGDPLKAALLSEGVSRYKTPEGTISVRLAAKRFYRTDFYDENGQPVYLIQHSMDVETPGNGA